MPRKRRRWSTQVSGAAVNEARDEGFIDLQALRNARSNSLTSNCLELLVPGTAFLGRGGSPRFVREGVQRRSRPDRTGEARDMVLFARVR